MADVHNPAAPPPAAVTTGDGASGTPPEHGEQKVPEKTFSQAEFDAALDAQVATAVAKSTAAFAGVDVAEYKKLKAQEFDRTQKELAAKGQFDALLESTVKAKDDEIKGLYGRLERVEIDSRLQTIAAGFKALMPVQVAALLRPTIRYDATLGPVVLDAAGVAATKLGRPVTLEEHVEAFLKANPHFLPAGPAGAGSQGSAQAGISGTTIKISEADARVPELYRAAKEAAAKSGKSVEIDRTLK